MATLSELCSNIPTTLTRKAVESELLRRKNAAYLKRMEALRAEKNVFGQCQQRRPSKGKYKNRYSKEESGTVGTYVRSVQTSNPYISVTCKSRKMF